MFPPSAACAAATPPIAREGKLGYGKLRGQRVAVWARSIETRVNLGRSPGKNSRRGKRSNLCGLVDGGGRFFSHQEHLSRAMGSEVFDRMVGILCSSWLPGTAL